MREIKFRAWNGRFMQDNALLLDSEGQLYETKGIEMKPVDWPKLFYTGLKDKNGVEIFEGDLLKGGGTWEVIFNHGEFKLKYIGTGVGAEIANMATFKRVIGNIYENPELIDATEVSNE